MRGVRGCVRCAAAKRTLCGVGRLGNLGRLGNREDKEIREFREGVLGARNPRQPPHPSTKVTHHSAGCGRAKPAPTPEKSRGTRSVRSK